eukprot:408441_1
MATIGQRLPSSLKKFVHSSSVSDLVECLAMRVDYDSNPKESAASIQEVFARGMVVTDGQRRRLLGELTRSSYSMEGKKDFLIHLPIFETFNEVSKMSEDGSVVDDEDVTRNVGAEFETKAQTTRFVNISEERFIPPKNIDPRLLTDRFIRVVTEDYDCRSFVRQLGVSEMDDVKFFREHVFPRVRMIPDAVRNIAFAGLLNKQRSLHNKELGRELRAIKFVPANDCDHCFTPSMLFDPEVEDFKEFLGSSSFPAAPFNSRALLIELRRLGLRRVLTLRGARDSAKSISELVTRGSRNHSTGERARKKSRALLAYLDTNWKEIYKEFSDDEDTWTQFQHEMRSIKWLQVRNFAPPIKGRPRPHPLLPWKQTANAGSAGFASAVETRVHAQMWLCSATLRILSATIRSQGLVEFLGVSAPIDESVLHKQLVCLSKQYHDVDAAKREDTDFKRECEHVGATARKIYGLLDSYERERKSEPVQDIFRGRNIGVIWIDVEHGFAQVKQVAFDSSKCDGSPYLWEIPTDLSEFESMFQLWGVRPEFSAEDYVNALKVMQRRFTEKLPENDLKCSIRIVMHLSSLNFSQEESLLYVPSTNGILLDSRHILFNDAKWMSDRIKNDELQFLHPKIDQETAIQLGIRTLRSQQLQSSGSTQDTYPGTSASEIKVLLKTRQLDSLHLGNPNEMEHAARLVFSSLEAADSIGCKDFQLLFDHATYGSQSVLSSGLASVQGPAINIVFDKALQVSEVLKYQQIEPEPKATEVQDNTGSRTFFRTNFLLDLFAISDVLFIISGDLLIILDPSGNHFIGASGKAGANKTISLSSPQSQNSPGKVVSQPPSASSECGTIHVFNFVQSDMAIKFPDQLEPFSHVLKFVTQGQVDLTEALSGTVIRAPLRTRASSVCDQTVSRRDARRLLDRFAAFRSESLLFTRCVRSVAVHVCNDPEQPHTEEEEKEVYGDSEIIRPRDRSQTLVSINLTNPSDGLFAQRQKIFNDSAWKKPLSLSSVFRGGPVIETYELQFSLRSLDENGKSVENSETWLVVQHIGTSKCRNAANALLKRKSIDIEITSKLLPLGGVAFPLKIGEVVAPKIPNGRLFCGPVPVSLDGNKTGLPFHASGCLLLSGADRARFSDSVVLDMDEKTPEMKGYWNGVVIRTEVAAAMNHALKCSSTHELLQDNKDSLYNFWPVLDDLHENLQHVIQCFYAKIMKSKLFLNSKRNFSLITDDYFPSEAMTPGTVEFVSQSVALYVLPAEITADLKQFSNRKIKEFTPELFRKLLNPNTKSALYAQLMSLVKDSSPDKIDDVIMLLSFAMNDLPVPNSGYGQMVGLTLAPMQPGAVKVWGRGNFVLATSAQRRLFPAFPNYLHSRCLDSESLRSHLEKKQTARVLRFRPFGARFVSEHAASSLFSWLRGEAFVEWIDPIRKLLPESEDQAAAPLCPYLSDQNRAPSTDWICALWNELPVPNESEHAYYADFMKFLKAWPLLPLTSGRLAAVGELPKLMCLDQRSRNAQTKSLFAALSDIGYPVLDVKFFPAYRRDEMLDRIPVANYPSVILRNLEGLAIAGEVSLDMMSHQTALFMVNFFDEALRKGTHFNDEDKSILRSIPMFEIQHNGHPESDVPTDGEMPEHNVVRLSDSELDDSVGTWVQIQPGSSFPLEFETFLNELGCVLVFKYSEFYNLLGVETLCEGEVFLRFLRNFVEKCVSVEESSSDEEKYPENPSSECDSNRSNGLRAVHRLLEHLRARWTHISQFHNELEGILKKLRFVVTEDGTVRAPTELFDPRADIPKRVFGGACVFPARDPTCGDLVRMSEANFDGYLDFLVKFGLKKEIDHETFVECAERIESKFGRAGRDDPVRSELLDQATGLVTVFTVMRRTTEFCNILAEIAFVPANAPSMSGTPEHTLARFKDCVLQSDTTIAWTVCPVITSNVPPDMARRSLQIRSPPSVSVVLEHLGNLSNVALDDWKFADSPEQVFTAILQFLSDHWRSVSADQKATLRTTALVPIGSRLLRADRLYLRMGDDLAPFMFEVPRKFLPFETILKDVGAKESASVHDYSKFLSEVYRETRGQKLNINELNAVVKVINLLSEHLHEDTRILPNIYVPCDSGHLAPVSRCVYADSEWLAAQLGEARVQFVSSRLGKELCTLLQIPPLSKAVRICCEVCIHLDSDAATKKADELSKCMHELVVSQIVERIWKFKASSAKDSALFKRLPNAQEISRQISEFSVQFVSELSVSVRMRNSEPTGHPSNSPEGGSDLFVDSENQIVYLRNQASVPDEFLLARAIDQILGIGLGSMVGALAGIIRGHLAGGKFSENADKIASLLEVPQLDHRQTEFLRGVPGEPLTPEDRSFGQWLPPREYLPGEVVGVNIGDGNGSLRYGVVGEQQRDHFTGLSELTVRVDEKGTIRSFCSTDVLSFRSNVQNASEDMSSPATDAAEQKIDDFGENVPPSAEDLTVPEGVKEEPIDFAHELASTLSSLSRRLGVESASDARLIADNLRLRKSTEDLEEVCGRQRTENDEMTEKIDDLENAFKCRVCQDNDTNAVIIPCGHLICTHCFEKLHNNNSRCPWCRQQCERTIKFRNPLFK